MVSERGGRLHKLKPHGRRGKLHAQDRRTARRDTRFRRSRLYAGHRVPRAGREPALLRHGQPHDLRRRRARRQTDAELYRAAQAGGDHELRPHAAQHGFAVGRRLHRGLESVLHVHLRRRSQKGGASCRYGAGRLEHKRPPEDRHRRLGARKDLQRPRSRPFL